MKKLHIALLLLLCTALLWGCGKQEPTNQPASVSLYYNLDQGAQLTPDANGTYTVNFVTGTEKKAFTVTDKALMEQLQVLDFVGLTLDGNTITGITRMADMPYQRLAWNYYVQSLGGNSVKTNTLPSFVGKEVMLKLPDGMPVYDVIPGSAQFGETTHLQKNDCISVIADASGQMLFAYVTSRPTAEHDGLVYCQHCDSEVQWQDWLSGFSLPTSTGHYMLQTDVNVGRTTRLVSGNICLDLNGKTVTQTTFGQRVYYMTGSCTLSIMDSVGSGKIIPNSGDETTSERSGMAIYIGEDQSTLNLYGGTLDGSNATSQTGCVVSVSFGTFNMYGGTILGGTVYGTGSSAITATSTFNMYGGRVVGGKHISTDYAPLNPPGGAAIRVLGTTTIYGGIIEGGETYIEGGVIRLTPDATESGLVKLILKGGTITGGTAPIGGGIYAKANTTIVISGDVQITGNKNGNLYLEDGASLIIGEEGLGENAQIGISTEKDGAFISESPAGADIAKHFTCDDPGKQIVNTGNNWSIQ